MRYVSRPISSTGPPIADGMPQLDDLRAETASLANESDDSGDEHWQQSTAHELARTPADRHGFLFGHNLQPRRPDLQEFRPLPSQIPFLFQTYVDNVNCLIQVVYAPTVSEMVRNLTSSNPIELTAGEEALMFAIYYAAITSMEDEDVSIALDFAYQVLHAHTYTHFTARSSRTSQRQRQIWPCSSVSGWSTLLPRPTSSTCPS